MTLPVDTAGNPRIDFAWGNFPIQPDDQRVTSPSQTTTVGGDQNVGWTYVSTTPSAKLTENPITVTLNQLTSVVSPDSHIIAYQNWDSYPATDAQIAGSDTAPSWAKVTYPTGSAIPTSSTTVTVPNVIGNNLRGAFDGLHYSGLNVGTITYTNSGATLANDRTVEAQSVAAGASGVTQGTAVNLTVYKYQDSTTPGVVVSYGYVAG